MTDALDVLTQHGIDFVVSNYSALDRYFGIKDGGTVFLNTDATLIELAKVFDDVEYPGHPYADASLVFDEIRYAILCVDDIQKPLPSPFSVQKLLFNARRNVYLDPCGIYADLRKSELVRIENGFHPTVLLMEAAKLVSRYHYAGAGDIHLKQDDGYIPSADIQRELLVTILGGSYPEKGLSLLLEEGFIEKFWPELYSMYMVSQSKDHHPEGDVWQHTLETFKHRKKNDLMLSLGLLLHDIGKPVATATSEKPFNDHSHLGTVVAQKFLTRLGFPQSMTDEIVFLIRYHMMPAALKRLPLFRTREIMNSPSFPRLLELYRADLESSFRSPKGYYEACKVYRDYMKDKNNPYVEPQRRAIYGRKRY